MSEKWLKELNQCTRTVSQRADGTPDPPSLIIKNLNHQKETIKEQNKD